MRFRLGLAVGFGAGYYLGARAGRGRYEQLNAMVRRARRSAAFGAVTGRARAVVDLGVERAREVVGPHGANGSATPADLAGTEPPPRP